VAPAKYSFADRMRENIDSCCLFSEKERFKRRREFISARSKLAPDGFDPYVKCIQAEHNYYANYFYGGSD